MKKIIFSIMLMVFAVSTYAQQTTVEGSKFFDNTSVSIYGGGQGWINPDEVGASTFWKGIRPVGGVAVNKWFTPILGAEIFYEASTNLVKNNHRPFGNLGLNAQLNLNNAFHAYRGRPDLVEVVPFAGLGWGRAYSAKNNYITSNLGVKVDFNMGKQRAWQINLRPSITYEIAGSGLPVQFNSQRAYTALQVGVTYKFGHRNSTKAKTHNFTNAYAVADYQTLQRKYDDTQVELAKKPKTVEVEKVVVNKVVVTETQFVKSLPVPHFLQNLAIVDATSVALLDELADEMKSNNDEYVVTGYASLEGSERYNRELSIKRAEAIKKCLVDRGVSADRIETVAGGATDKFGPAYEQNRIVVISK